METGHRLRNGVAEKNETWSLVEKPSNKKILPCKWIFTVKTEPDGSTKKKARLVIGGHR